MNRLTHIVALPLAVAACLTVAPSATAAPTVETDVPSNRVSTAAVDLKAEYRKLTPPVAKVSRIMGMKLKVTGPHLGGYRFPTASGQTESAAFCYSNATTCDAFRNLLYVSIYDTANVAAVVDFVTPPGAKAKRVSGVTVMRCTFSETAWCGVVRVGKVTVATSLGRDADAAAEKRFTQKRAVALLKAYKARG